MNIQEYYDLLDEHDWFYQFSDDMRVYNAGNVAQKKIQHLSETSTVHRDLYLSFQGYIFSGPSYKTAHLTKPVRP